MTTTPSRWRARKQRQAALRAARHAHGEEIRQLWADSAAAIKPYEFAHAGRDRVPERLRVEKPEPVVIARGETYRK